MGEGRGCYHRWQPYGNRTRIEPKCWDTPPQVTRQPTLLVASARFLTFHLQSTTLMGFQKRSDWASGSFWIKHPEAPHIFWEHPIR